MIALVLLLGLQIVATSTSCPVIAMIPAASAYGNHLDVTVSVKNVGASRLQFQKRQLLAALERGIRLSGKSPGQRIVRPEEARGIGPAEIPRGAFNTFDLRFTTARAIESGDMVSLLAVAITAGKAVPHELICMNAPPTMITIKRRGRVLRA